MVNYFPEKLLEYIRDGLVEQEQFGFIVRCSSKTCLFKLGDDSNYPFYLRSCAKPLQGSLIIDFKLDTFLNMSLKEIALCCSSHSGEPCHVSIVKNLLKKTGIDKSDLKCGIDKPLSRNECKKLIISGSQENILQNNCSGKHAMMLAICKKNGWDCKTYDEKEHPLQIAVRDKIYELCELNEDYAITKDGCGVPIYAMPLENMAKGYLNLFLNKKYSKIRDAFLQNPYLISGENRLDNAIMNANENLIAKSGASGIFIVVNLKEKEALVVKVLDDNMKARAICVIEALKQLGWLDDKMLQHELIKKHNKRDILTHHNEKVGEIKTNIHLQAGR